MQLTVHPEEQAVAPSPGAQFSCWLNSVRSTVTRVLRTGNIHRRTPASDPETDWTKALEQVIGDLDRLNQETERDFLSIGGKLAEFIEAVGLISSELAALRDLISGEHGLRASQALTCALDHSTDMRSLHADRNAGLSDMRQEAMRLKQTLAGFEGTVSTFRTLGVLTRIETARLGSVGADFGNLADDVKALATDVQARVETALVAAVQLIPPIQSATQNISALDEGQAKNLPGIISGVLASISAFRDIQTRAHDSSGRMAAQYEAISDAFKKLIVSIQFHDITRQQVEHVIGALRRVRAMFEGESGNTRRDPRGTVAAIILQSSQLADAEKKFAASVASVIHNLDEVASRVREMAEESRMLSGLSEDEKNSFFLEMEKGCTAILGGLSHCAEATAATRVTSIDLAQTIARMRGSIDEIQAIEIQMQRMALNAGIRAAHIGPLGDALSVLAGAMQQGAFESRRCSESLVDALALMSQGATNLFRAQGADPEGEDSSVESMRKAVAELHSSSERSFAQIARITACGARLRENISATRASFSVGSTFADAVGRAREMLAEIGDKYQADSSSQGDEGVEQSLADFARHYTMQAERDIHGGTAKTVVGPPLAEVRVHAAELSEELGENVEFF